MFSNTKRFAAVFVLLALSAVAGAESYSEEEVLAADKVLRDNQAWKLGAAGVIATLNGAVCASELKNAGFQIGKVVVQSGLCALTGAFVGYGAGAIGQDLGVKKAARDVRSAQAQRVAAAKAAEVERQRRIEEFKALPADEQAKRILQKQTEDAKRRLAEGSAKLGGAF